MKTKKATSTFILRDPKATKSLIFIVIRIQGQNKRLKFTTGESINPKHWDKKEKRAKLSTANGDGFLKDELILLNSRLAEHYDVFRRADIERMQNNQEPTLEYFREEFVKKYGGRSEGRILYLNDFIEKYMAIADVRSITIKAYKVAQATFKEYEKHTGRPIAFDTFKTAQFDDFVKWMQKDKKLAKNTIGSRIKNLKAFFNKAFERTHHTNEAFRKFKSEQEESVQVSLTEEDLQKIINVDLTENSHLEPIRDIFIIGCRTALRFGDWGRITPEMIDFRAKKIRITTGKTLASVVIPLHPEAEKILQRYDCNLPRVPSNQKSNTYIRKVCKLAKIDQPIIITRTIAGETVSKNYKKHELITSHSARRTAATLMYRSGIDALAIMKITGHKDMVSFLKYVKVSEEENADRLLESDYFKTPLRKVE